MANKRMPQPLKMTPLTVRVADAAQILGIGRTKIYELIAEHEIEVVKLGSATLIVVGSLQAFIERQLASAPSASQGKRRPGRPRTEPPSHSNKSTDSCCQEPTSSSCLTGIEE